jgi:hypothetical protein
MEIIAHGSNSRNSIGSPIYSVPCGRDEPFFGSRARCCDISRNPRRMA